MKASGLQKRRVFNDRGVCLDLQDLKIRKLFSISTTTRAIFLSLQLILIHQAASTDTPQHIHLTYCSSSNGHQNERSCVSVLKIGALLND